MFSQEILVSVFWLIYKSASGRSDEGETNENIHQKKNFNASKYSKVFDLFKMYRESNIILKNSKVSGVNTTTMKIIVNQYRILWNSILEKPDQIIAL